VLRAPAKVNLFLRVLGRRPDGFHEVQTLLQAIDLHDELTVQLGGGDGVDLAVVGPEPCGPRENLAWRAAERFAAVTGLGEGVRIRLEKRIPAGAGLGGGSSDAGAVLRALCHLTDVHERDAAVTRVAAGLGADVPFFLSDSPLALATGRGDVLEPLEPLPAAHLVLSLPPVHVSTASAYGELARARAGVGARGAPDTVPEAGSAALPGVPAPPRPRTWREVMACMRNDFEAVVPRSRPEIARALDALREEGASAALLCGSGAASFGLFGDRAAAEAAASILSDRLRWPCWTVRTLVDVTRPG
jgi:4-diphosphocytidyl-2-C-methyl-D-erythritol kinase